MTSVIVDASALIEILTEQPADLSPVSASLLAASEQRYSILCPPLARSEALAMIRRAAWSGLYADDIAQRYLERLEALPITIVDDDRVPRRALEIATAMGWARTYDAEYCALAELRDGLLLTCDERLQRGAVGRLDYIVGPESLIERLEQRALPPD